MVPQPHPAPERAEPLRAAAPAEGLFTGTAVAGSRIGPFRVRADYAETVEVLSQPAFKAFMESVPFSCHFLTVWRLISGSRRATRDR